MWQRENSNHFSPGSRRTRPRKALFLGLMLAAAMLSTAAIGGDGTLVQTKNGPVQGFINNGGVYEFLGIPYAAPPVGSLRWMPPRPHRPWNTPLQATAFGSNCPQNYEFGVFAGPPSVNEDCLFLNVFTVNPGRGQVPVLVWIHGGGLFDGESTDYDASKLAEGGPAGPTVVVTINYRLGLLGYLANPALDSEGHLFGNYGLMDQQAALRWVRDNIAAFGGDPDNVTLGGQSAGSTSTAANMISPAGKGLFHRAIWESGPLINFQVASLAAAETKGTGFATAAGCNSGTTAKIAACLRALSVPQILTVQGTSTSNGPDVTGLLLDGTVLPIAPDTAWTTGKFSQMPILHGSVKAEYSFIVSANEYYFGPLTAAGYVNIVKAGNTLQTTYKNSAVAAKVLALYPLKNYASPSLAYVAVGSDSFVCGAQFIDHLLATNVPSVPLYTYEFQDAKAPWYFPKLSFPHGAAHTIDIQFLFPLWHGGPDGIPHPLSLPELTLSDELVTAWTSFMYTGNPNLAGNAPWPPYTTKSETYLLENTPKLSTLTDAQFSAEHNCAFWDKNAVY
jgi:para-nitrobenzyl esterase